MSFSPEPPEPSTYVGRTITLLHGYSIVETPNATAMNLQFINSTLLLVLLIRARLYNARAQITTTQCPTTSGSTSRNQQKACSIPISSAQRFHFIERMDIHTSAGLQSSCVLARKSHCPQRRYGHHNRAG